MEEIFVAGDFGATHLRLSLVQSNKILETHVRKTEDVVDYINEILNIGKEKYGIRPERCCLGIAGPVQKLDNGYQVEMTNVDIVLDSKGIKRECGLKEVLFVNDMEALANSIPLLSVEQVYCLNEGKKEGDVMSVVAAGTGLGKSIVNGNGIVASEGGHVDCAVYNEEEFELLKFIGRMRNIWPVSYEEIVSGRGIEIIYEYFTGEKLSAEEVSGSEGDEARRAMKIFVKFYARCCKNFALECFSNAGVFLAGGIAVKNPGIFDDFMDEFTYNSEYSEVLGNMPVYVINEEKAGIMGAANFLNTSTEPKSI